MTPSWSVVVPTLGRPSLGDLLASLAAQRHQPLEVLVVDDRRPGDGGHQTLDAGPHPASRVLVGGGRGPAHARNVGWRASRAEWVVFVDDDVLLPADWSDRLLEDLHGVPDAVAGVQAVVDVPLPARRRPTDWERGTAGLADGAWITAEMAYRRTALALVGGLDERFPRAFREDADLALRVQGAGYRLVRGTRRVVHPVRPADAWASVRQQRGNVDDALMRRLHGPGWHEAADSPRGALRWHVATVAAAVAAGGALAAGRRPVAGALAGSWAALTARFAWRRIAPGPRTPREVAVMTATSVAIPPAAVWHRLRGEVVHRGARPWRTTRPVGAVLFDRDGTLVHDVPYNGDPALVRPVAGAREVLDRLRARGVPVGVVTNQSGVARGRLTRAQVDAVNRRVEQLLGPFGTWQVCEHGPEAGCACRKPAPGMVLAAAAELGVAPHEVVLIGDIGADVEAAEAAGGTGILVPTPQTLPGEVAAARHRAATLAEAVDQALDRLAPAAAVRGVAP